MPQGYRLPRIKLYALFLELAGHVMGQRQVHVVAANEQVVTHRHATQDQLTVLLGHTNQRQICRATADIADQECITN